MSHPFLSLKNIKKTYKNKKAPPLEALKGISLDLHEGEIFGLLGMNGAGKTTLSSIIATLNPPSSGEVIWKGCSVYQNLSAYRKIVGFCPQKPNLDPVLTLDQNLEYAGRFFGLTKNTLEERKQYLIDLLELESFRHGLASTLSGGYRQRFLIARSLIHAPRLLILDEPTVGMDPHIRHELWEVIRSLKKEGVTIILTTHYLEEAEALVDRVCMMDFGEVQALGPLDEVMRHYDSQKLEDVLLSIRKKRS